MLSPMFAPVLYTFLCPSVNIFYNPLEYTLGFRSLLLSQKQLNSAVIKGAPVICDVTILALKVKYRNRNLI